jgi:two-component system phosphate regulon sensor histidine kinase PhoR
MGGLVDDLLDLSRIESGKISISPRPVALSKVAEAAIQVVQDQISARGHVLEVEIPENLPNVNADPDQVARVWTNLLSNAYTYTPFGGLIRLWAQPHASTEAEKDAARWVVCAVQDTGVGIDLTDQDRVFEPFYRVRRPETAEEPGSGLGLPIARGIVELHGGHIWLDSELNSGSTFYFTLPFA